MFRFVGWISIFMVMLLVAGCGGSEGTPGGDWKQVFQIQGTVDVDEVVAVNVLALNAETGATRLLVATVTDNRGGYFVKELPSLGDGELYAILAPDCKPDIIDVRSGTSVDTSNSYEKTLYRTYILNIAGCKNGY